MDLLLLGKNSINPDKPAGTDITYEPEFEALQAEINKLYMPSSSERIDWKNVGNMAALILANKSKDLRVAGYFAVSQVHTNQIDGLVIGITVLHDMIEQFWDKLFPSKKRMRGRLGAIEWWVEWTEHAINNNKFEPVQNNKIEELKSTLNELNDLLTGYISEPPNIRPIMRHVEKIPVVKKKEEITDPHPKEEKLPPKATDKEEKREPQLGSEDLTLAQVDSPELPREIVAEDDVKRILNFSLKSFEQIAGFWFKKDSGDPRSYRFRRMAAWLTLDRLPSDINGITLIPPPQIPDMEVFKSVREEKNWQGLLRAAEPKVSKEVFWIDLNRMVAEALSNLGNDHQDALDAVCQETALFVHRIPGLINLSFSGGTPFADEETRQWLKSIALGSNAAEFEPIQITESHRQDKTDRMEDAIKNALSLVRKKKIIEAVSSLQEELQGAFSQKEALLWRLALCRILISSKKANMALPHLEAILEIIERYKLEKWDPELALKGFKIVWQGFNAHSDKAIKQQSEKILNRIGKIYPVEALRLAK